MAELAAAVETDGVYLSLASHYSDVLVARTNVLDLELIE